MLRKLLFLLLSVCSTYICVGNPYADDFESVTPDQGLADPVIYCFAQDPQGYIWIGTKGGLTRYDGYRFTTYTHTAGDTTSLSHSRINCLMADGDTIYIGTDRGLNLYDIRTGKIRQLLNTQNYSVKFILHDANKRLWIGTNQGLLNFTEKGIVRYSRQDSLHYFPGEYVPCGYLADDSVLYAGTHNYICRYREDGKFNPIPLPFSENLKDNLLLSLIGDKEYPGHLWLGTEQGLIRTDMTTGKSTLFLPNTPIKSLLYDENGSLWIGTDNGLYIKSPGTTDFTYKRKSTDNPYSLQNDVVWTIFKDRESNLWFGTDNGISIKQARNSYNSYSIREITGSNEENLLFTIHRDNHGNLWLGGSNGLIRWHRATGKYEWFKAGKNGLSHNKVRYLYEDPQSLWIATDGGLNCYNYAGGQIHRYIIRDKNEAYNSNWMYCIVEDKAGKLWLGTYEGGIFVVDKKQLSTTADIIYAENHFGSYTATRSISGNIINSLALHPDGAVWAGTDNSGINRISTIEQKVNIYTHPADGLSSNFIKSLAIDDKGEIWIGADNGLNYLKKPYEQIRTIEPEKITDPVRFITIQNDNLWFGTNIGIACYNRTRRNLNAVYLGQSYFSCATYYAPENRMYLGAPNGVIEFYPDSLLKAETVPSLQITGYSTDNDQTQKELFERKTLRLPYRQNSFSVEFSAFLYRKAFLRYAYRLKGYDNIWREIPGISNRATYINVPPGQYTFEVGNVDSDGTFMDNTASVEITILPPWYRTTIALLVYILLLAGIVIGIIYRTHKRHRQEIERVKREKTMKLTRMKLDFFANVSHEFKTPLSLIIGYISQLIVHETDNEQKRQMQIVRKNADKIHTLINQMLDYKEGENKDEELILSETTLPEFIREIFTQFETTFREKGINAEFTADNIPHTFSIDRVKMESVLTNLLSNASKFVSPQGHIRLSVTTVQEDEQFYTASISIEDDGCGIPANDLPKVFDRYFISQSSQHLNKEGSGIGLDIARKIVEQHGGTIGIRSEENKGTCVTITLTTSKTIAFTKDGLPGNRIGTPAEKPFVLVVEDNTEIREFITSNLSEHFCFLTASNGKEGVDIARKSMPQLIITDLMMPEADGEYLCRSLRNNVNTAFIPVIILTARNDSQTELQSYEYADAFITKPFDLNYLYRLSEKLITKSRKIAEKTRQKEIITPQVTELISPDEQFLKQITHIIEESLSDPDLNVTTLCQKSGINDKQVYRKIKQLTGMSVVEYIRSIRLKKAAMFLRQDKLSVSEIMYLVGFSNASYFTRCFKEEYGVSPKEFTRQNNTSKHDKPTEN